MTRKERNERAGTVRGALAQARPRSAAGEGASLRDGRAASAVTPKVTAATIEALQQLATRDDGWLRFIPSRDGADLFLKWKFTHGPHERHYVMARTAYWQIDYCFTLLMMKLSACDQGDLSYLAKDRMYNHLTDEQSND